MPIEVKNISHIYMENTPYEKKALNNVSLIINEGEFVAIAGHTGSGKSTLMQHFNGLLNPTKGEVFIDGIDINKKKDKKTLNARRSVGMVFQYPEQQLPSFCLVRVNRKKLGIVSIAFGRKEECAVVVKMK